MQHHSERLSQILETEFVLSSFGEDAVDPRPPLYRDRVV